MFTRHDQLHGTKSCIDHIFTDIFQKYKFNIAVENILQVDHHAVMLNVSHLNKQSHKVASKYITFTFTDHDKIINSKILTKAPAESFNTLIDFIKNEIQKNTSTKSYKERFRKSFMNVNIYNFMKIRDNYLKLLTKYPNIQWITDTFKKYRNLVNKLIRQEKKKKNDEFFLNNLSDPKKTWKKINSLLTNTNMMKMENCVKLKIDDIVVDNRFQIADEFNKHFVMVAKNIKDIIASKIINSTSFQSLDDYEIKHQFDFPLSDENEILNVISNLKSSNARDIFELSNNTVKLHRNEISKPLSIIINNCISDGIFPVCLKKAIVKPLYKEKDKQSPVNYRPISILPIFSKIFEAIILNRLLEHLNINKLIHDFQFGFVANSNTEIAALHLLNNIYNLIEEKKIVACLFIDLKKAFDCVDHEILLKKLKSLKPPRNIQHLFESYLSSRQQCVNVDNCKSGFLKISSGVFQGSILGPILFAFYINTVFKLNLKGHLQLYADDIAIAYGAHNHENLKKYIMEDLMMLQEFFNSLGLEINNTKTKYVQFQGRRRLEYFTENSLDIKLYDQKIERVENYKYLGLFIDESLSFIKHIENIKSKILPMAYAIKRIRPLISEKISLQLYFANIHSHLTFMNPLWSVATNLALNTLFIIQKKCLRFIKMKTRLSPSHELFSENILPLPALNNYQLILLAFKLKNQLLKNNIKLNYVGDIHSYGTRRFENFHIKKYDTRYGFADFFRRGLLKYNEIPDNLKRLKTLGVFKNRLKELTFDQYEHENDFA